MAQTALILDLFRGLAGGAGWHPFLHGLLARTGADRVHLLAPQGHFRVVRGGHAQAADPGQELAGLDHALGLLRPGRIYALDELRHFDSKARRAVQDKALVKAGIADARVLRIGAAAWLILLSELRPFAAADSALLSGLAPAIEIALAQLAAMETWQRRASAAEGSLMRLGIGQAVMDETGTILAADPLWQAERATQQNARGFVVQRAEGTAETVVSFRLPPRPLGQGAEPLIAATLGLSKREAALAALLADGHGLIEAGQKLGLSAETTRSYSKRIYAKTGAKGQADLVRLILTGLAPLA